MVKKVRKNKSCMSRKKTSMQINMKKENHIHVCNFHIHCVEYVPAQVTFPTSFKISIPIPLHKTTLVLKRLRRQVL